MGFLDEVTITARSGDGGKGCVSFRREKYLPKGGPDGGDGGTGGGIILKANATLRSLDYYGPRRFFRAKNGEPGKGQNKSGKQGPDLFLDVPLGTIIEDVSTGKILADLTRDKEEFLLLRGGKGGKGNQHFATSTNRVPRYAQPGKPGLEKKITLSLKFLADIGIIGLPNAGKSTLLSRLSSAHPKIDDYPFTTIFPNLGVIVSDDSQPIVIADIPGLIEGAGKGRGLGHRFLKHIERTRLLLHLLDITTKPKQVILWDFDTVMAEMEAFSSSLLLKPQIVLLNKTDIRSPEHRNPGEIIKALSNMGIDSMAISALTGEGLPELKKIIFEKWKAFQEKN